MGDQMAVEQGGWKRERGKMGAEWRYLRPQISPFPLISYPDLPLSYALPWPWEIWVLDAIPHFLINYLHTKERPLRNFGDV